MAMLGPCEMQDLNFARVVERVRSGAGNEGFSHFLKSAARAAQTDTAFLAIREDGWTNVIASYQLPIHMLAGWATGAAVAERFRCSFITTKFREGLPNGPESSSLGDARWNYVVNTPINMPRIKGIVSIVCADLLSPQIEFPLATAILKNIGTATSNYLRLIEQLTEDEYRFNDGPRVEAVAGAPAPGLRSAAPAGEDVMVTGEFLLGTLVKRRQVCARGDISYSGIRQWRTALKPYQIAALKALKQNLPDPFVERVASELAQASLQIAGSRAFDRVVGVACGHSGPGCLSERLSMEVARQLGIMHEAMFEPLPVKGVSHPKANVGRARMVCLSQPKGRYLVIDDVATSGAHISEATRLLRTEASPAVPLVWIAG